MAAKKKKDLEEAKPGQRVVKTTTVEHVPVDETPDEDMVELESFFNEIGGDDGGAGVRYKLYQIKDGKRTWLTDGPAEQFNEATIQKHFGAGDFLIRAIAGKKWIRSKTISIGPPVNGNGGGASDQLKALELRLEALRVQGEQQRERESNRMHELMLKLVENRAGSGAPTTLVELTTALQNLQGISGGKGSLSSVKEALELVEQVNALRSDGDDSMVSLLKPFVPKMLEAGKQQPPPPPNPPAVTAVTLPVPVPSVEEQQKALRAEQPAAVEVDERRQLLNLLKDRAKAGKDPEFWADYIEENADKPACDEFLVLVDQFEWSQVFPGLITVDAEMANEPYKTWFERLYRALRNKPMEPETKAADAGKVDSQ